LNEQLGNIVIIVGTLLGGRDGDADGAKEGSREGTEDGSNEMMGACVGVSDWPLREGIWLGDGVADGRLDGASVGTLL